MVLRVMVLTPPIAIIGSVIPATACVAISALFGYTGRFCLASRQRMAAVVVPCCLGCSWKLAMKVKRRREREEQRKRRDEERKRQAEEYRKRMEKLRKEKEEKEEARQAAKAEAMAKFDAGAKDGKIEKSRFREAFQPYIQELVKFAPLEELLKKAGLGAACEEVANKFLPMADVACEEAAHIVDCDKFLDLLFGLIDKNGDGSIERSELEVLIDELLSVSKENDVSVLQQSITALAFRFTDRNKDGKVDVSEAQFLLDVILELTGFAVTSGLHVANALVEAPVFEEEIAKMMEVMEGEISESRKGLLESIQQKKTDFKALAPDTFWSRRCPIDPAVVYKGLLSMVDAITAFHYATESSEGNPLTTIKLTANELLQGGIDEESFVGMLAPMIKKRMMAKPDLGRWKNSLQAVKTSQGGSWPIPECEELEAKLVSAVEKQWDTVQHTIAAAQGNAAEVAANFSRALFELSDIDCDGKISQREISTIKEFFNCFVTIAVVLTLRHESVSKEALPEAFKRKLEELCPAAFAGADDKEVYLVNMYVDSLFQILVDGFDFLDKNADGKVTKDELGGLVVKLLRVGLRLLQSVWDSYLAGASAFSSHAFKEIWEHADITEVTLENLPVVTASVQATILS